jgi:hypothetical protein
MPKLILDDPLNPHRLLMQMGGDAGAFQPRLACVFGAVAKLFRNRLRDEFAEWHT